MCKSVESHKDSACLQHPRNLEELRLVAPRPVAGEGGAGRVDETGMGIRCLYRGLEGAGPLGRDFRPKSREVAACWVDRKNRDKGKMAEGDLGNSRSAWDIAQDLEMEVGAFRAYRV